MDPDCCPGALSDGSPEEIVTWLRAHVDCGPRRVRSLYKKFLMQNHVIGDAKSLHAQLRHALLRHRGQLLQLPLPSLLWNTIRLTNARGVHIVLTLCRNSVRINGWPIRLIISDESDEQGFGLSDTCLACRTCFWSAARLRLQQHLRLSRNRRDGCYEKLTWCYAPLKASCVASVPQNLRGFARLPATLVPGVSSTPLEEAILNKRWCLSDARQWLDG